MGMSRRTRCVCGGEGVTDLMMLTDMGPALGGWHHSLGLGPVQCKSGRSKIRTGMHIHSVFALTVNVTLCFMFLP